MAPRIRSGIRVTGRLLVLVFLGVLLGTPAALLANGGTLRLANVVMGDYRVSVFTDPTPVRPDSLDVSVLVLQEGEEGVPEGLDIIVRAELLEHPTHVDRGNRVEGETAGGPHERGSVSIPRLETLRATRAQADDPRYYAAKFGLGSEGRWRITVSVRGEAGEGEAAFEINARERGLLGHPFTIVTLALLPLAGAAWWVLREEVDENAEENAPGPT